MHRAQKSLPASYYRGGTSRAIIFQKEHLPQDTARWPSIFRAAMGSPDPNGRQLNVWGKSERDDADVDYTFAAIGIKVSEVDFSSNCGNMISAIGPFAVDSGLVNHQDGKAVIIHSHFPAEDGEAVVEGDFAIDGVAGTGAKIELAFLNPAGSKTGETLPTGNVVEIFDEIKTTCIDVNNPCVFVSASSLEVEGGILVVVSMGIAKDINSVPGSIPKIAMVSAPHEHLLLSGEKAEPDYCDVIVRAISVGQPHRAVPITVAIALVTASRLDGSTVHECTSKEPVDRDGVTIGHNSGKLLVGANFEEDGTVRDATVFRTARRIMNGTVYWVDP
ncbi:PrpF protein [Lophiotrema nucula]|uniref:PrpF protein n=1 Tax=Lophiotrema nucula TaxID=690887 RepID=A0A6A5ZJN9_9PLEO|nr:PrpF protein [Lophiotrema nucula]